MELIELKNKLLQLFTGTEAELDEIKSLMDKDSAMFPFNEYEFLICSLLNSKSLSYEKYIDIRTDYINKNPNLWIFEMTAPRPFGEGFAHTFVETKCSKIQRPSKKLDPSYSGEYDLWLDGISIEVKASRAVDDTLDGPLYMKALSRNTAKSFVMNFQQLKPQCCNVFIWIAVFRDSIVVWVMNSREVQNNPLFSKGQHRGNKGKEGQLHITNDNIQLFSKFELKDNDLEKAIRDAAAR